MYLYFFYIYNHYIYEKYFYQKNEFNCICIQYYDIYENLFLRLKLYDSCIGKTIIDIDKLILRKKNNVWK